MTLRPNQRAQSLTESVTLAIAATARRLRSDGKPVVSLSAGEPDFGTIEPVAEAGITGIRNGETRYTSAAGTPELRAAGSTWLNESFGLDYSPAEVMATAGVKPALHIALMSLVEPGDRVLLLAPYWASYPSLVQIAGGVPVDVPAVPEQGFLHSGEQLLAAARESGAKGVLLNYPNNPTGAVPTRSQVEALAAAAAEADLWIISDEIYSALIYDDAEHHSPALVARDRTLVTTGGSKSHGLTGWRIGFLAGPEAMIQAAAKIQSQAIGNPASPSQAAGLAAARDDHSGEIQRRVREFDSRRRYMVEALGDIAGLRVDMPKGAFYVMVDCRELCSGLGIDDVALAERLLEEELLAVVPGTPFAAPGFIRLSYAAAQDELEAGVARIRSFVERHG